MTLPTQPKSATVIVFPVWRRVRQGLTLEQLNRVWQPAPQNSNRRFKMRPKTPWGTRP